MSVIHLQTGKINKLKSILVTRFYLSVFIETLQDVPAPVPVLALLSEPVQVEQAFYSFWSQQVVSVCRLKHKNTLSVLAVIFHIPTGTGVYVDAL